MRHFIADLRSPAGKRLTPWLSFVMSDCEFVTFPVVSWVRCGTCFYQFLIFALFLTFQKKISGTVLNGADPAEIAKFVMGIGLYIYYLLFRFTQV